MAPIIKSKEEWGKKGYSLSTSCEMYAIIRSWQQQCNCCPFVLVNANIKIGV